MIGHRARAGFPTLAGKSGLPEHVLDLVVTVLDLVLLHHMLHQMGTVATTGLIAEIEIVPKM